MVLTISYRLNFDRLSRKFSSMRNVTLANVLIIVAMLAMFFSQIMLKTFQFTTVCIRAIYESPQTENGKNRFRAEFGTVYVLHGMGSPP